jgi:hypothetical protein
VPEFVAAQAALVRDNVELTLENSQRLAQLSVGVVERAIKPERANRAA